MKPHMIGFLRWFGRAVFWIAVIHVLSYAMFSLGGAFDYADVTTFVAAGVLAGHMADKDEHK